MSTCSVRPAIAALKPYVPGLSIEEIRQRFGLERIIKLASNENPLGVPPLAQEAIRRHADAVFRYPQGGNPRLAAALAVHHGVEPSRIAIGNGSDEILDLLLRMLATPFRHNVVCFAPCFSIYTIQSQICDLEVRQVPLNADFSFDFDALLARMDENTRLVFITTPDNPSGYCPPRAEVSAFAACVAQKFPQAVLVIDEAYVDFAGEGPQGEQEYSLLAAGELPANAVASRTFSKSYGLAGIRLGYAVMPVELAQYYWRTRLPFSVSVLAEESALAALQDQAFREATLSLTRSGRAHLTEALQELGFQVWPSHANFLLCKPAATAPTAKACFEALLQRGIIIRPLQSYQLPDHLRITIGTEEENSLLLAALRDILA